MVVGVCCGVSRLINLSLDIDKLDVSCWLFGDVEKVEVELISGGGIDRMLNGVDGDTSPNDIGGLSMRGLLSDEQTGRSSIGGEYVVIVSGNVMPEKRKKKN